MIRRCNDHDIALIFSIINDGALAYKGVIPEDRWTEPYMPMDELRHEINQGVVFWGYEDEGRLQGVMGIQQVEDVSLIRHAYVRTGNQRRGIGAQLLSHLRKLADSPLLVGTWSDAAWAVRFYERHGFETVSPQEKDRLLKQYWKISERQIDTSVVLASPEWQQMKNKNLMND